MPTNPKTKLVCTIGPASNSREMIKKMIINGMNVVRLNFSHGSHDSHRATIRLVRDVAAELGVYVGVLQDLCGPKIRLGRLPNEGVRLIDGEEAILAASDDGFSDCIPVDYPGIYNEVKAGERILIADGMMELIVNKVENRRIYCRVITGGIAFTRKGVNMPQSKLQVAAFSEKDRADLLMGLQEDVDFVAMSFVRSVKDLEEIKQIIAGSANAPKLIAKIEKPQAVENLNEILEAVDGVMVARGDLGVEMPLEQIPHIQKKIIKAARTAGRMVITATQMLASMVASPRPTRGETTDVANAVLDGTDALMLSDETANGRYPDLAVETLFKIARAAEPYAMSSLSLDSVDLDGAESFTRAIGRAACWLAKDVNAAAIVCFTTSGFAAYSISMFRPDCKILAVTLTEGTCRRVSLIWGANAVIGSGVTDTDTLISEAMLKAKQAGVAHAGDKIIVTAGLPFGVTKTTSFLRIVEVD